MTNQNAARPETISAIPARPAAAPWGPAQAKELFEKRFAKLIEALRTGDLSEASFPLVGDEARLQLQSKVDTLQWVLEMWPEVPQPVAAVDDPLAAAQERVKLLEKVLGDIKLRISFMGWPAEAMWQVQEGVWAPDWRRECALVEHALHGTPLDEDALAKLESMPANTLPGTLGAVPEQVQRQAALLTSIRELMGYVENGSDTKVSLSQDDATKDFIVNVGKDTYYGAGLAEAVNAAVKGQS